MDMQRFVGSIDARGGVASVLEEHRDTGLAWLDSGIAGGVEALLADQKDAGYWCYELEADCTIPAEYVLMTHFTGEPDPPLEAKIANYLRRRQGRDGGWPLFYGGDMDLSCSVKSYYALKVIGDSPQSPHMERARAAILARGGAARANVFTRILLALFGQVPWRAVPFIPVEIMLLPRWFPFHISKVSYWSRTVMVPLFVLCSLKPRAANPRGVQIDELFVTPPELERDYFPVRSGLNRLFLLLDQMGRGLERLIPRWVRRLALKRAEAWTVARMNGDHGLGGIFPAMVNAREALGCLGYDAQHPLVQKTSIAIRRLLVVKDDYAYCQPCNSPVWDTALASLTLQEAIGANAKAALGWALDWCKRNQLLAAPGDWAWKRPHLRGGGWAFQFRNSHYPDIDDTPVVAWAMLLQGAPEYAEAIERAAEWISGMQSKNGGFASFDVDNTHYYLNEIPFADHGALLDPPTSDVTARCVTFLTTYDSDRYRGPIERALAFIRAEQEPFGGWFGRWGTNYIYGTWSVLTALHAVGESPEQAYIQRAIEWLKSVQREDGGWGEGNDSYYAGTPAGVGRTSTAFQTAWALLGLVAAGEVHSDAVRWGVEFLLREQREDGFWHDDEFTAPGFPRVFYLKYHGYTKYFPLWALAKYRNALTVS